MQRLDLKNEQAAHLVGVPERQIRRWRNGETAPSWVQVLKLAKAFERTPEWFYTDHDDDEPIAVAS